MMAILHLDMKKSEMMHAPMSVALLVSEGSFMIMVDKSRLSNDIVRIFQFMKLLMKQE